MYRLDAVMAERDETFRSLVLKIANTAFTLPPGTITAVKAHSCKQKNTTFNTVKFWGGIIWHLANAVSSVEVWNSHICLFPSWQEFQDKMTHLAH